MYDLPLMNHKPESLECQVIANLMDSWRRNPLIMVEIIEEGKADKHNGKNLKAVTNSIIEFRLTRSRSRKETIKRKQKALRLLDNFSVQETSIITGLAIKTLNIYLNDQNTTAIAV